jgi:molybdate transport system ATP-binding protein
VQTRLEVRVKKRLSEWSLDVDFGASSSSVAIWGPSGSGKTVTLKILAGLPKPDSGYIRVGGKVLFDSSAGTNLRPQKRSIGMVFQNNALFPHLTVAGNLGFARASTREKSDVIQSMASRLHISGLLDRKPSELSGGQCQRVALGRALLANPEMLLLDEPFSSLDVNLKDYLRKEMAEILDAFDVPVIIVTHDPEDIRALATEVVVYSDGRNSQSVVLPDEYRLTECPERHALCQFLSRMTPGAEVNDHGDSGLMRATTLA